MEKSKKYKLIIDDRVKGNFGIGVWIDNVLKNLNQKYSPLSLKGKPYDIFDFIRLSFLVPRNSKFLTFYHSFPVFRSDVISYIFIHDMYWLDMKKYCGSLKYFYFYLYYKIALPRVNTIFTVSKFTASRIEHYYPLAKNKIRIIGPGNNHIAKLDRKVDTRSKNLLVVLNDKPYKKLDVIVEAYNILYRKDSDYTLNIVGSKKTFKEYAGIRSYLNIERNKLANLYDECSLYISASEYEGYGLPTLEAISRNKKILVLDLDVNREVGEGYPNIYYYSKNEANYLANKIEKVLNFSNKIYILDRKDWSDVAFKIYNIVDEE